MRWRSWLFVAMGCVIALRAGVFFAHLHASPLARLVGREVLLEGRSGDPPDQIHNLKILAFGRAYPVPGIVKITGGFFSPLAYGDVVRVQGLLASSLDLNPVFQGRMTRPQVAILARGQGNAVRAALIRVREWAIVRLEKALPEPAAAFAAGILLGSRASLPKAVTNDFRRAGLSHILAISGANIVIVVNCITALFSVFPKKIALPAALAAIVLFAFLVGASPSVVRAALMGSLPLLAKLFGRRASGLRALCFSAGLMLAVDPFLAADAGFELSFAATAGLILLARPLEARMQKVPARFGLREILASTLAAQIFTLPVILIRFQNFSAIAPIANVLILPFIPFVMLGSAVVLVLGSSVFGQIFGAPLVLLIQMLLAVIHALASLSFAAFDVGIS